MRRRIQRVCRLRPLSMAVPCLSDSRDSSSRAYAAGLPPGSCFLPPYIPLHRPHRSLLCCGGQHLHADMRLGNRMLLFAGAVAQAVVLRCLAAPTGGACPGLAFCDVMWMVKRSEGGPRRRVQHSGGPNKEPLQAWGPDHLSPRTRPPITAEFLVGSDESPTRNSTVSVQVSVS